MAAVNHQPCFHTVGQASFSATLAGRADNLCKDLETKSTEWEKEREGLQSEVTRLEQRAVQAEALVAEMRCQREQLEKTQQASSMFLFRYAI